MTVRPKSISWDLRVHVEPEANPTGNHRGPYVVLRDEASLTNVYLTPGEARSLAEWLVRAAPTPAAEIEEKRT